MHTSEPCRTDGKTRNKELFTDSEGGFTPSNRRERRMVRRHSRLKGREGTFWRGITRRDARTIVLAARKYEVATREAGNRTGALGSVAIEILDYFTNLVDYRTGRLDPSIETLMVKLRRSRDAIVRGLKALRIHGFLDWIRRYVPTGNEGRGVQVQQTSNAYRLSMPKRALKLLGRYGKTPPVPADLLHAQAEQELIIENHRASLSLGECALFDVGDNPLGQALARLGNSVKQRESAEQTESPSRSIIYRNMDTPLE